MVLETYHRKRTKKPSPTKMQLSPVLGRQQFVPTSSDQLKVGSIYEIDHVHLPARTPSHLRSIRIAMVSGESTDKVIVVRYPSMKSLRAFFSFSKRETHPALDEKFDMGTELAGNVLVRLVPVNVFNEQKSLEGFWLFSSGDGGLEQDKKGGSLFDKLKINGRVGWGIRRQVKYLGKHMGGKIGSLLNDQNVSTSLVSGEENEERKEDKEEEEIRTEDEENDEEEEEKEEEENEDDEVEEEESEEEVEVKIEDTDGNLKRKRYPLRNMSKKKPKKEEKSQKVIKKKKKKYQMKKKSQATILKNPKDRWSSERYKQAENSLVEVMKEQKATAEKPILRPQLRVEARKKIGDTGLLDHLLKHMAGKLAPGGDLRFRRRHNADGAMQYWLENAELVNIRKDAGVSDPYWIPPPGWKHGDSPNQDPICARELKLLKDEIVNMKRNMDLVATHKELEEEVGKLRKEVEELSKRKHEESQITTLTSSSDFSQKLEHLATSLVSSKSGLENDPVTLAKYKEQLLVISDLVKEIEGNVGKIIFEMDEKSTKLNSSLIAAPDSFTATDHEQTKAVAKEPNTQQEVLAINAPGQDSSKLTRTQSAEQKAAKIQRLKSGFRICKPQGTFLWPDMVKNNLNINVNPGTNNSVMVQLMDHVPTPPSVSSSAPPQLAWPHQASSPVKPKPEKRAVSITVSSPTAAAPMINLNDSPVDPIPMPLLSTTTSFDPRNVMGSNEPKQNKACSSSSASSFPLWSLSTPKYASDESRHG